MAENYGGAETITITINPDGTLKVELNEFAERDSQPELDELIALLEQKGIQTRITKNQGTFTGEYHKHTHSHGVHSHTH
jgi:hypothetical protein